MSAVACADCGHGYDEHDRDAGHCQHAIGEGVVPLAEQLGCPCAGFRWLPAGGEGPGGYGGRPEQSWPGP